MREVIFICAALFAVRISKVLLATAFLDSLRSELVVSVAEKGVLYNGNLIVPGHEEYGYGYSFSPYKRFL